jgi:hypothetical protein
VLKLPIAAGRPSLRAGLFAESQAAYRRISAPY